MVRYPLFKRRNMRLYLEQESPVDTWTKVVVERRLPSGNWEVESIRVPVESLRSALAKLTIRHEVSP